MALHVKRVWASFAISCSGLPPTRVAVPGEEGPELALEWQAAATAAALVLARRGDLAGAATLAEQAAQLDDDSMASADAYEAYVPQRGGHRCEDACSYAPKGCARSKKKIPHPSHFRSRPL